MKAVFLLFSQVCSVCGLRADFHMDDVEDEIPVSVHADGASKVGDGDEEITVIPRDAIIKSTDKDDESHGTTDGKPSPLAPGSVDLILNNNIGVARIFSGGALSSRPKI